MRASRLVNLLLLLQNRGRLTAQELADELEVSVRTVYRDVEALGAAGIPIYGEPGHDGGYRLVEGYRTRLTGLTGPEAGALFLTGLPGAAAELGLGAELAATQLKLSAALPPEQRVRAERMRERFHLDAPGWYRRPEEVPLLMTAADAVWEDRRMRIRYRRWEAPREVDREVSPLGLVLKAGRWYLIALGGRGGAVAYRVANLLAAEILAETFERPDFDLGGYWQEYLADFEGRRWTGTAVVRFSPAARERLRDVEHDAMSAAVRDGEPDANGWITATIPIESPAAAATDLLRIGGIEAVSPPELRDLIRRRAQEVLDLHG
ncbi:helix-turn-helix transcriptional regulator [Hamadaea tsunoensis]|uniref:helix-turn-helix transcriptional regulator n=1 Tax=Hamadaea tsunoensis TaxID=53368 RepID=UPI0005568113|nr:WYL domain-containing protein [Hamadaea tsunoensis]